eukprot:Platyproteum_vivax@DN1009_c0_g1_i1.p1
MAPRIPATNFERPVISKKMNMKVTSNPKTLIESNNEKANQKPREYLSPDCVYIYFALVCLLNFVVAVSGRLYFDDFTLRLVWGGILAPICLALDMSLFVVTKETDPGCWWSLQKCIVAILAISALWFLVPLNSKSVTELLWGGLFAIAYSKCSLPPLKIRAVE